MSHRASHRIRCETALRIVVAAGLSVFGAVLVAMSADGPLSHQRFKERAEVHSRLSPVRAKLERAVHTSLALIQGISAYVSLHPNTTQADFASISRGLIDGSPFILNVGAAPDLVVQLIYPMSGNEAVLGLDYRKETRRWAATQRAISTGKSTLAGPVDLAQGGRGLIAWVPVFADESPDQLWGILSAAIDTAAIYRAAGLDVLSSDLDIVVRGSNGLDGVGEVLYGGLSDLDDDPITMIVELPGGEWQLSASPKNGWVAAGQDRQQRNVLIFALALFFFTLASVYIYHRHQVSCAESLRMSGAHRDTTERKRIEAKVVASERLLSRLAAQVPGALCQFLLRPDGTSCFPFASDGVRAIFGVRPEQIVENASLVLAVLHPEDLQAVRRSVQASARTLAPWHAEYRVVLPGQAASWREGHAMPECLDDGSTLWYGFTTNIDERKRVELALETSELRYRGLVERTHSEYLIYSRDTAGMIKYVSPSVEHILGYTSEQFLGHYSTYRTESAINEQAEELTQLALQGTPPPTYDAEFRHKNGEHRCLAISETPVFGDNGRVEAVEGIAHDITVQRRAEEEINRMALSDPLTGLANRNQFNNRFKRALSLARRQQRLTGLLMLDLDHFKPVNDQHGHSVGDALLKKVAAVLAEIPRSTDTVARLGGDEFAIIVVDPDGMEALAVLARRCIKILSRPLRVPGHELRVGVSVGISCFPNDGLTIEELMEKADRALYAAKAAGRNTHCFSQP